MSEQTKVALYLFFTAPARWCREENINRYWRRCWRIWIANVLGINKPIARWWPE